MSKKQCPFVTKQSDNRKRLKLLQYGPTGAGKTITAIQFPKPIVIDMERGTEHYEGEFGFDPVHAITPEEVWETVEWLMTNDHDYLTLVIDPATVYYTALQAKWNEIFLQRNKSGKGFKFEFYENQPRDWGTIKAEHLALNRMLSKLDMNIVVNCHQKDLYAEGQMMQKIGVTFNGVKGFDYFFDTVVRLWRTKEGKFMGLLEKDRTNTLPNGEFEMSYSLFENGLGKEALTRKSEPVKFATDEQKDRLETYFVMFELGGRKIKRMLAKYDTADMDELTEATAAEMLGKFGEAEKKRKQEDKAA